MSILIDLAHPAPHVEVRPLWQDFSVATGDDGRTFFQNFRQVSQQWQKQAELEEAAEEEWEEIPINYVPFQSAGKISVRFLPATPMKPLQIDMEDLIDIEDME